MYTECRVKWRGARTPCALFLLIIDSASISLLSISYLILLTVKPKKILYSQGEDVVLQAALHFPEMIKKPTCQISWPIGKDVASLSTVKTGGYVLVRISYFLNFLPLMTSCRLIFSLHSVEIALGHKHHSAP